MTRKIGKMKELRELKKRYPDTEIITPQGSRKDIIPGSLEEFQLLIKLMYGYITKDEYLTKMHRK